MTKEEDEKLCKDFPEIYRDRYAPMDQTALCWGFSCGSGWFNLIYTLSSTINDIIFHTEGGTTQEIATREALKKEFRVVQVKEKFGTLRFYVSSATDEIYGAIYMAESLSAYICEECGNPGSQRGGGWIRTLCDADAKKLDYEDTPEESELP